MTDLVKYDAMCRAIDVCHRMDEVQDIRSQAAALKEYDARIAGNHDAERKAAEIEQPWIGAFSRQVMELNFVLDEDINRPAPLARILMELGLPASDILDKAQTEPTKTLLREQTEHARVRGIFGAPTFFVRAEMFWGNDRLDDALLFASDRKR